MPVTQDKPGPYATTSAITDIIARYRNRGLPFPVNADVLARAGISDSLIPRTLQSLKTLDLINEIGNPTETLEGIRLAPEAEYKKRLEDWLKGTYAGIFAFVDPTKDGSVRIRDAFRGYNPVSQQDRMVALFEGLCTEAGLLSEKSATKTSASMRGAGSMTANARVIKAAPKRDAVKASSGLPPALAGLMESLPAAADGWTMADRAKFLKVFESVLDFSIPITKEKKETAA